MSHAYEFLQLKPAEFSRPQDVESLACVFLPRRSAAVLALRTSGEHAPRRLREQARPHLQVRGPGQPLEGGRIHILLHQLDLTDMAIRYAQVKVQQNPSGSDVSGQA